MKKTLRILGAMLCVTLMSLNFVSCKDEDSTSALGRIKSVLFISADGETEQYVFEYDSSGRIITEIETASDGFYAKSTYEYGPSKIIRRSDYGSIETYILVDGLIVSEEYEHEDYLSSGGGCMYTYENGRLKKIENKSEYVYDPLDIVEWHEDNMTEVQNSTYTYSDISADHGFNNYHNLNWVLYNQGFFGEVSKNVYKSETRYGKTTNYTFELENGRVKKMNGDNGTSIVYIWE